MKQYKFKIGNKEFECLAPSSDAAYNACYNYCNQYGIKGKPKLVSIN